MLRNIVVTAALLLIPASNLLAQRQPESPQLKCVPIYSITKDYERTYLMTDSDGDLWLKLRFRPTGKVQIGFLKNHEQWCMTVEGQHTLPEE